VARTPGVGIPSGGPKGPPGQAPADFQAALQRLPRAVASAKDKRPKREVYFGALPITPSRSHRSPSDRAGGHDAASDDCLQ